MFSQHHNARLAITFLFILLPWHAYSAQRESIKYDTVLKYNNGYIEFRKQRYQLYKTHSPDGEPLKSLALQFMQRRDEFRLKTNKAPTLKSLRGLAREVAQSQDPVFMTEIGAFLRKNGSESKGDQSLARQLFERSIKMISASPYPVDEKARALRRYLQMEKNYHWKYDKKSEHVKTYSSLIQDWLQTRKVRPDHRRFVIQEINHFFDKALVDTSFMKTLSESLQRVNDIDQWTQHMIQGDYHMEEAWKSRTHKKASEVSQEGWSGYYKHIEVARKHFLEAFNSDPNCPEPAARLISIAMTGKSRMDPWEWFDRCLNIQIDYYRPYAFMNNYLLPKWGGSYEQIIELGRQCSANYRYDTYTPSYLMDAIYSVMKDGGQAYLKSVYIYEDVKNMVQNYLKAERRPPEFSEKRLKSLLLAFAVYFKRIDEIKKIHSTIKGEIDLKQAWRIAAHAHFKRDILYAHAYSSKHKALALDLHKTITYYKPRSLSKLNQLLSQINQTLLEVKNPYARQFFQLNKKHILQELEYEKKGWVSLDFDKDMLLWGYSGGDFEVINSKTIRCGKSKMDKLYFWTRSHFQYPYEIEVTIDFQSSPSYNSHLQAGIMSGRQLGGKRNGRTFWTDGLRGKSGIGIPGQRILEKVSPGKRKRVLRVKVWKGYYETYIDGKAEYIETDPDFEPGHIGFGMIPWYPSAGSLTFSNMRVHKLDLAAPPPWQDYISRIDYYKERIKDTPAKKFYAYLSMAYYNTRQYKEGLRIAETITEKFPNDPTGSALLGWNKSGLKKYTEALVHLKRAVEQNKNDSHSTYLLIYIMSTHPNEKYRNGPEALKLALALNKKHQYRNARFMSALALAQAENGKMNAASYSIKKAMQMTKSDDLLKNFSKILQSFSKGKPWRDLNKKNI